MFLIEVCLAAGWQNLGRAGGGSPDEEAFQTLVPALQVQEGSVC